MFKEAVSNNDGLKAALALQDISDISAPKNVLVKNTLLVYATGHFATQVVSLLLSLKADPNVKGVGGYTSLHLARDKDTVRLLLEAGANIDSKDNEDSTPLQYAVHSGNVEIVEMLIRAGANVNTQNSHGWTPLHNSINKGYADVVRVLLNAGADKTIAAQGGLTAYSLAVANIDPVIIGMLQETE